MNQPANALEKIYAIGDIHGRLDLLERVVAAIGRDAGASGAQALTITLGDYIDRGPASYGVMERLAANPFPTPYIALKGNHETLLETFLTNPAGAEQWRRLGGVETLHSYGVPVGDMMRGKNYEAASAALREALPPHHRAFLQSMKTSFSFSTHFFCHAGVRPGVPLERQRDEDMLWIRDEFLDSKADFGKIVVHGHTPVTAPDVRPNRINIDTGAYASGRLTCIVLNESGHRFLEI